MTRHVGPSGSLIVRHNSKNPVRVAAGKAASKARQERDPQGVIRSSHLGYDCYITGNINGGGRTRVILRGGRLPPHLPKDVVAILPLEMWWPQRDHRACHAMIDAVLTSDINLLASWKSSWPDHTFGYEQYLELCDRRLTGLRDAPPSNPNQRTDGTAERGPLTLMFPGIPVSISRHGSNDLGTYCVRTHIVRFDDGLAALRVDVLGIVEAPDRVERVPCSRAYVDLITGKFEIIEHFPGHLKALGLPVELIYQVLGVRAPGSSNRRHHQQRPMYPRSSEPRPDTLRQHALKIAERARQAQTIMSTGDRDAEPVKDPVQRPDPLPVASNARYQRQLEQEADDLEAEFERFPDAPGSTRR